MASESLDNLARIGSLKAETVSAGEIERLIRSGLARLMDAKNTSLTMESRFDLAHNATYALAQAALWASGYRAAQRYLVFQCLRHTLDLPPEKCQVLDQAHSRRNVIEYGSGKNHATGADFHLTEALIRVAEEIAERIAQRQAEGARDPTA